MKKILIISLLMFLLVGVLFVNAQSDDCGFWCEFGKILFGDPDKQAVVGEAVDPHITELVHRGFSASEARRIVNGDRIQRDGATYWRPASGNLQCSGNCPTSLRVIPGAPLTAPTVSTTGPARTDNPVQTEARNIITENLQAEVLIPGNVYYVPGEDEGRSFNIQVGGDGIVQRIADNGATSPLTESDIQQMRASSGLTDLGTTSGIGGPVAVGGDTGIAAPDVGVEPGYYPVEQIQRTGEERTARAVPPAPDGETPEERIAFETDVEAELVARLPSEPRTAIGPEAGAYRAEEPPFILRAGGEDLDILPGEIVTFSDGESLLNPRNWGNRDEVQVTVTDDGTVWERSSPDGEWSESNRGSVRQLAGGTIEGGTVRDISIQRLDGTEESYDREDVAFGVSVPERVSGTSDVAYREGGATAEYDPLGELGYTGETSDLGGGRIGATEGEYGELDTRVRGAPTAADIDLEGRQAGLPPALGEKSEERIVFGGSEADMDQVLEPPLDRPGIDYSTAGSFRETGPTAEYGVRAGGQNIPLAPGTRFDISDDEWWFMEDVESVVVGDDGGFEIETKEGRRPANIGEVNQLLSGSMDGATGETVTARDSEGNVIGEYNINDVRLAPLQPGGGLTRDEAEDIEYRAEFDVPFKPTPVGIDDEPVVREEAVASRTSGIGDDWGADPYAPTGGDIERGVPATGADIEFGEEEVRTSRSIAREVGETGYQVDTAGRLYDLEGGLITDENELARLRREHEAEIEVGQAEALAAEERVAWREWDSGTADDGSLDFASRQVGRPGIDAPSIPTYERVTGITVDGENVPMGAGDRLVISDGQSLNPFSGSFWSNGPGLSDETIVEKNDDGSWSILEDGEWYDTTEAEVMQLVGAGNDFSVERAEGGTENYEDNEVEYLSYMPAVPQTPEQRAAVARRMDEELEPYLTPSGGLGDDWIAGDPYAPTARRDATASRPTQPPRLTGAEPRPEPFEVTSSTQWEEGLDVERELDGPTTISYDHDANPDLTAYEAVYSVVPDLPAFKDEIDVEIDGVQARLGPGSEYYAASDFDRSGNLKPGADRIVMTGDTEITVDFTDDYLREFAASTEDYLRQGRAGIGDDWGADPYATPTALRDRSRQAYDAELPAELAPPPPPPPTEDNPANIGEHEVYVDGNQLVVNGFLGDNNIVSDGRGGLEVDDWGGNTALTPQQVEELRAIAPEIVNRLAPRRRDDRTTAGLGDDWIAGDPYAPTEISPTATASSRQRTPTVQQRAPTPTPSPVQPQRQFAVDGVEYNRAETTASIGGQDYYIYTAPDDEQFVFYRNKWRQVGGFETERGVEIDFVTSQNERTSDPNSADTSEILSAVNTMQLRETGRVATTRETGRPQISPTATTYRARRTLGVQAVSQTQATVTSGGNRYTLTSTEGEVLGEDYVGTIYNPNTRNTIYVDAAGNPIAVENADRPGYRENFDPNVHGNDANAVSQVQSEAGSTNVEEIVGEAVSEAERQAAAEEQALQEAEEKAEEERAERPTARRAEQRPEPGTGRELSREEIIAQLSPTGHNNQVVAEQLDALAETQAARAEALREHADNIADRESFVSEDRRKAATDAVTSANAALATATTPAEKAAAEARVKAAESEVARLNALEAQDKAEKEAAEKAAKEAEGEAEQTEDDADSVRYKGTWFNAFGRDDDGNSIGIRAGYETLRGITGSVGTIAQAASRLGQYQALSNALMPDATQRWASVTDNAFFNSWSDLPSYAASHGWDLGFESCNLDDARRSEIPGQSSQFVQGPGGTYQHVGRIEAERTPTPTPIMCRFNPDEDAKEDDIMICSEYQICVDGEFCYADTDEDGEPDSDEPLEGYFYKITWGVSAPQDQAHTLYVDEEEQAVKFNIQLRGPDGNIWLYRRAGASGASVISLTNGDSDRNIIARFSAKDFDKACIDYHNDYQVTDRDGSSIEDPQCVEIIDSTRGHVQYTGSDQAPSSSTSSGDVSAAGW